MIYSLFFYIFIDSPTFCLSRSIFITFTFITSPTETISDGVFMYLSLISEMCTSPSCFTPISTNAPKSITFRTVLLLFALHLLFLVFVLDLVVFLCLLSHFC